MMKDIPLKDRKYFSVFLGKRILKRSVFRSRSKIPAYSANVFEPFGYVEQSNISDFGHDYILWAIDGYFELSIKHKEERFATTDHCGTIEILDPSILPEYLLNCLLLKKHELGFDRSFRPSLSNMKEIIVSIPVDGNGNFDLFEQGKLANKYQLIRSSMKSVRIVYDRLLSASLRLDDDNKTREYKLSDLFDPPTSLNRCILYNYSNSMLAIIHSMSST